MAFKSAIPAALKNCDNIPYHMTLADIHRMTALLRPRLPLSTLTGFKPVEMADLWSALAEFPLKMSGESCNQASAMPGRPRLRTARRRVAVWFPCRIFKNLCIMRF